MTDHMTLLPVSPGPSPGARRQHGVMRLDAAVVVARGALRRRCTSALVYSRAQRVRSRRFGPEEQGAEDDESVPASSQRASLSVPRG
jgi:hypothetical protein